MDFNTQVCTTLEQSERLLALGLKKETADCRWVGLVKDARGKDIPVSKQVWSVRAGESEYVLTCGFSRTEFVPAWSLHRLMAIANLTHVVFPNRFLLYEDCIGMIEDSIQKGLFNREYLEETK